MANISRRHVLAGLGTAGFATSISSLSGLGFNDAWAADTSGYKAMICIFLKGGMDGADTLLPFDEQSYGQLRSVRSNLFASYQHESENSTRNRANLLPLNFENASDLGGRQFALPRELTPLHSMFNGGDLAVVGNVGPLIEPTTRQSMDAGTAILPKRLFSHNDQQSTWMSFGVEGIRHGWGGRFMDQIVASNPNQNRVFSAISATANDVFLAGQDVTQFKVATGGVVREPHLYANHSYLGTTREFDAPRAKIREFLSRQDFQNDSVFEQDFASLTARAVRNSESFAEAKAQGTPFNTQFPKTLLSNQLRSVAETIKVHPFLNVSRQMFYCSMGGFDTHSNQSESISRGHLELAEAISAFRNAMIEIGEWDNVVVFTASDFGRTLIDNGNGTDHGWGGHQIVAGGQVRGKWLYGEIPEPEVRSEAYTKSRGRLIPTTSVEQYAATMGSWFGLDKSELNVAMPNLSNFRDADLGFMGGV